MKKTILIIIILLIVGIGIYYLISATNKFKLNQGEPTSSAPLIRTQNSFPVETNDTNLINDMVVTITDSSFIPSVLTVLPGTKVTWTNKDSNSHTVTSDTLGLIESSNILPGQSFTQTFQNPGTFKYHCNLHPNMKGRIIVVEGK